jgi:hypothetical protein
MIGLGFRVGSLGVLGVPHLIDGMERTSVRAAAYIEH